MVDMAEQKRLSEEMTGNNKVSAFSTGNPPHDSTKENTEKENPDADNAKKEDTSADENGTSAASEESSAEATENKTEKPTKDDNGSHVPVGHESTDKPHEEALSVISPPPEEESKELIDLRKKLSSKEKLLAKAKSTKAQAEDDIKNYTWQIESIEKDIRIAEYAEIDKEKTLHGYSKMQIKDILRLIPKGTSYDEVIKTLTEKFNAKG